MQLLADMVSNCDDTDSSCLKGMHAGHAAGWLECVEVEASDLSMLTPSMVTVTHPRTVKDVAVTACFAAAVRDRIMVCMAVFATTFQDPAPLRRGIEERLAGAFCVLTPAT